MKHPIVWLLVANGNSAFIYDFSNRENLDSLEASLIKSFDDPDAKLHSADLGSDESGRYKSKGARSSPYAPDTSLHDAEVLNFAHEINDFLTKEHKQNKYQQLVICAEPHFLGILEKHLSKQAKDSIKKHIQKDYIPLINTSFKSFIEHLKEIYW